MEPCRISFFMSANILALGLASPVLAQDAPAEEIGIADTLVTVQKRTESVRRTPLVVSAVSGAKLASRQISDFEKIVPSFPTLNFGNDVDCARVAISGLKFGSTAAGQEGNVTGHSDGVNISRHLAQLGSFFDILRWEMIRGPQGTPYGHNASAAALDFITNDPSQNTGSHAELIVGNSGLGATERTLTGASKDKLSARIALQTTDRGSYRRIRSVADVRLTLVG